MTVELDWRSPSDAVCDTPVSTNTSNPSCIDDGRNQNKKDESVIVVSHDFEKMSTMETITSASPKIRKFKMSEAHENKPAFYSYVGKCNSFGSSSVSTHSTYVSTNPSSGDSGSRRLSCLSSFEDSTASGSTTRRSYGSFEDSVSSNSVSERLVSSKANLRTLKSIKGNDEVKATHLKTPCPVHERLAKTETVATARFKKTRKEKKRSVALKLSKNVKGVSFNRHTQGKFSAPELRPRMRPLKKSVNAKNTPSSPHPGRTSRMNESGQAYANASLPFNPALKMENGTQGHSSSYHADLRQKMDKLVLAKMKESNGGRGPLPTKLVRRMESNEHIRVKHSSRRKDNGKTHSLSSLCAKSASKTDESGLMLSNSTIATINESGSKPTSISSSNPCNLRELSPPACDQSNAVINENDQKILPRILPPRPMMSSGPIRVKSPKKAKKNKPTQKKSDDESIFDRLATTGTAASLWKNANFARYANGYDTFNESVANGLYRTGYKA